MRFPSFTCFVLGSFSKMDFRRRPFNQKPLVFRKNPRTHLEVQGSFGDEGTFQECQKSRFFVTPLFGETENWRPVVYIDAEYVSAHFCCAETASIAIWGKTKCVGRKFDFQFFPSYWDPKHCAFQNGFHTHKCDRTSHVCVRARTFATHTLVKSNFLSSQMVSHSFSPSSLPLHKAKWVQLNGKTLQVLKKSSVDSLSSWVLSCQKNKRGCVLNFYQKIKSQTS